MSEKTKSGREKNPRCFCHRCERTTQHRDASYVGDSNPDDSMAGMMLRAYCTVCSGCTSGTD